MSRVFEEDFDDVFFVKKGNFNRPSAETSKKRMSVWLIFNSVYEPYKK